MIQGNLQAVRRRVEVAAQRVGRDPAAICVVAVSKTHPAAYLREAIRAGVVHLGENRIQEAASKKPEVEGGVWHLIGPLQRNKAKLALELFDFIHTVDRPTLAERLQRLLEEHWPNRRQRVLIEINVGSEDQKAGVAPGAAGDLLRLALECPALQVEGLMAIPPWGLAPEASRPYFQSLRRLREELQQSHGVALPELSMGMSQDFEVAVEEGATIVRVGTAIFGARG